MLYKRSFIMKELPVPTRNFTISLTYLYLGIYGIPTDLIFLVIIILMYLQAEHVRLNLYPEHFSLL